MTGFPRPKKTVQGVDVAGRVEAVGPDVAWARPGDEVFGACDGAFAEYVCGKEAGVAPKPSGLSFEQAAAVPLAGCTALQALRDHGHLQAGQNVLINGAGGGVGTFAVQVAKALGAHVTGVCSTRNVEMVRSLGAHQVVDYTTEDFTRNSHGYDLVVDLVGNRPVRSLRRPLVPGGVLVLVGGGGGKLLGPLSQMLRARLLAPFLRLRLAIVMAKVTNDDLVTLTKLIDAGDVTPVVDRVYRLSQAPEAVRHVETMHGRGKTVITVAEA
jgi:NADPH:quinone reductase-like Zn-dependent oxidoreductase